MPILISQKVNPSQDSVCPTSIFLPLLIANSSYEWPSLAATPFSSSILFQLGFCPIKPQKPLLSRSPTNSIMFTMMEKNMWKTGIYRLKQQFMKYLH